MAKDFEWKEECLMAFKELKEYLNSCKILSRLVLGEDLFIYFVAFD